jgi:DNA helicase-2/ATP-dependent DNA helicase PcrA
MKNTYLLKENPLPARFTIDYEKELNPSQLEVVKEGEGACLVLAGAGSGKTRTLIYRVAYLLEKGIRPEEILLVTFTNKAANEMKNRVEILLKTKAKGLWCGTFHHIGHRVLRMYGKEIGLADDFGILDEEDSRDLIKVCAKAVENPAAEARFPKPAVIQSILSFAANAQMSVSAVLAKNYAYLLSFTKDFEKIQAMYAEKKRKTNNLDYDDLLLRWIELLEKSENTREKLTAQFRYCLVDEYQDTNRLQRRLIQILSGRHRNILVVGDDAQSIYSFRAADIKNILDFPQHYSQTKIFKLETNYRSTRAILELANESIKNNVHQFPKTLRSIGGKGSMPQMVQVRDARQQADFVCQRVQEFEQAGVPLSEIAILFRAHYQAAELEMELAKRGMPYVLRGGVRFFEQAHVKDALSFLKILSNPLDEIAWVRALTLQPGIGPGYAAKIFDLVEREGGDLQKVAGASFGAALPTKVKDGFLSFKKILKNILREEIHDRPDMLIQEVMDGGYQKYVLLNFENARDRVEDLKELVNFAHTYKKLKTFLADVTLREGYKGESLLEPSSPEDPRENMVLSTIHQAKGLEWKVVFVIGLSEGQFPHAKSMEDPDSLEEERRLFYVAATRAKEELILIHPMMRYDYQAGMVINRPSIFISELPGSVYDELEVEEEARQEPTIYLE